MDFYSVVQLFISGISLGAVYALIAVGFAIVYSIMKFSNFAHGGMISACAYIGYFFQNAFETPPPFFVTVLFAALCGIVMALCVDTVAYSRIRKKQAPNLYYFLASITVAILIEQILSVFFGKNLYGYPAIFKSTTFNIGAFRFSSVDTLIMLVSLAILAVLIFVINKTKIGLAIRTVAISPAASRLMGINSNRVIMTVFVIAGALAGISGVLLGTKYSVYKGYGFAMLCEIATAILSGGTTSNYIYKTPGRANIAHCFIALDYGMFGDKAQIEANLSKYLQEVRDSNKAEGQDRIYIHGEKEAEAHERVLREGVYLNDKTYAEMQMIGEYTGASDLLPAYLD